MKKETKPVRRKADAFAGKGSMAAALKARREAIESGNVEGASKAYRKALRKSY